MVIFFQQIFETNTEQIPAIWQMWGKGVRHWACLTMDAGEGDQNLHLPLSAMTLIRLQSVSAPMFSHLEPEQM